jgi:cell division topological specificity factor
MNVFDLIFRRPSKTSAHAAKERLQIILSHDRAPNHSGPDFLPVLQQEIIQVIAKYFSGIEKNNVKVGFQRTGSRSVLELNIDLPE